MRRRAKYWWTNDIAKMRKECTKLRRRMTRMNRRRGRMGDNVNEWEEIRVMYIEKRNELKKGIRASKEKMWKDILDDLNKDVWGKGYKIVTGKLGMREKCKMNEDEQMRVAREFFPVHPRNNWPRRGEWEAPFSHRGSWNTRLAGQSLERPPDRTA